MDKKPQIQKFRDKAKEIGADISAEEFEAALRKVAKANPDSKDLDDVTGMLGQTDPNKDFGRKKN